ncbi:MAG TPA: SLBB domain-containing protein [Steroidobacteraceae bacterium]|nr:SLBB domain-containing protein [Steroidobacteraceae bacterium]
MARMMTRATNPGRLSSRRLLAPLLALTVLPAGSVAATPAVPTVASIAPAPTAAALHGRTAPTLGAGDSIQVQVFGQPDMSGNVSVDDDGSVNLPLVGHVKVGGLTLRQAEDSIATAIRKDQLLVNPRIAISVVQARNLRVSIIGEVRSPGRYAVDPRTSIIDLLAQAGGTTESGGRQVYILHTDAAGKVTRRLINLDDPASAASGSYLQGGDSVIVPRAQVFYVYGEVAQPNAYRLEPGMTVVQAIARAGGVTPRGSDSRIDVKRTDASGKMVTLRVHPGDLVRANDVIYVRERIF